MADLAQLAMTVEDRDVLKATTSLNSLTVAGGKSEAAAQRLTRRMALLEIEARSVDAAMGKTESRAMSMGKAWAAAGAAIAAAFVVRELVKNTTEAQNAMAQLEAAVKSTGGVAGRSVEQLDAFSMAMQRTTVYSDEAVKGAQAMLLTFDKIRGTQFDQATQAVADLAARMGGDLQGAAVQVGKALQDPATGLTALRRSGVSFSESQITLIKRLYDTNRAAEGQAVILKELEHQFGGSAAAARDTLGGAITHLSNAFGDLFEISKGGSASVVAALNAMAEAMPGVRRAFEEFITNTITGYAGLVSAISHVKAVLTADLSHGLAAWRAEIEKADAATEEEVDALIAMAYTTTKATDANVVHAKSIKDIIEPSKAWLKLQKEIAHIMTEAIVASLAAQAKRLEGIRGLQQEEEMQERLVAALRISTKAYEDQKDAEDARQAVASAGIVAGDAEYDEAVRAAQAIIARRREQEELTAAQKEWNDMLDASIKKDKERAAATPKATQSIIDSMKSVWEAGKKLYGAAGAGFGVGFGIGTQSGGNHGSSAIGGVASGAMVGFATAGPIGALVGGLAGLAGGMLGASKAAREADKAMQELQKSLMNSMAAIRAQIAGDSLGGALIQNKAQFDALRKQTEDAYAGGKNEAQRNVVLAQLNQLEAQRIAQLKAEAALVLQQLNEDVAMQILRNNGRTEEADAMAKAIDQERRFAALRLQGISEATIALLAASEVERDRLAAEAAAKQAAADAELKAAEDIRIAADAAAAAAEKAANAMRAMQDLDVELLRAQGKTGEAADMEFDLAQRRRIEEAEKSGSPEFVTKTKELLQIYKDQRAAQQLIDSTGGGGSGAAAALATSAVSAVQSVVTERSALMLVDLTRQEVSYLARITTAVESGGGAGGGGVRITIHNTFTRKVDPEQAQDIADMIIGDINAGMGTINTQSTLRTGSVAR